MPQRHMEEISHAVISGRENGFGIISHRLSRGESGPGAGPEYGFMLCHSYSREGGLASLCSGRLGSGEILGSCHAPPAHRFVTIFGTQGRGKENLASGCIMSYSLVSSPLSAPTPISSLGCHDSRELGIRTPSGDRTRVC